MTIVKIEIDDLDSPKKFTITLSDDTVCEIDDFDDDTSYATENVANLKGAYTFDLKASGKTYSATIAILNDGSIAVYTEYSCEKLATGGDSFQKEGEEASTAETIPAGKYVIEGSLGHSFVFGDEWTFELYLGGETPYSGTYSWDDASNVYKGADNDDETYTFTLDSDGNLTVVSSYATLNGKYVKQADQGSEEEDQPPTQSEFVTYTGSIKLENYYGEWTLLEIKFDKSDIVNTLTFKVAGSDEEYTAEVKDPADIGGGDWLGYFRVNDGSQRTSMAYVLICFKYGDDENTLIIADANSTSDTFGTLTLAA